MNSESILLAARACLNTPFRHQGRIPGVALDCAGLVVAVAKAIGADYIDQTGYGRLPIDQRLSAALDAQPCLVRVAERHPGDVLLLRFGGAPQHLAIADGQTMIHCWETVGRVVEHAVDAAWERRIAAVYRFQGVA